MSLSKILFHIIACPLNWALKVLFTRIASACRRTQNTYCGRIGINSSVPGSYIKHPCLQISSGFKLHSLHYETSLVSLQEICNCKTKLKLHRTVEHSNAVFSLLLRLCLSPVPWIRKFIWICTLKVYSWKKVNLQTKQVQCDFRDFRKEHFPYVDSVFHIVHSLFVFLFCFLFLYKHNHITYFLYPGQHPL